MITLRGNGLPVAYRVSAIEAGKKTGDIKNPNGETIGVHRAARGFFRQVEKRGAFAVPLFACPETVFAGSPPPAEFVGSYLRSHYSKTCPAAFTTQGTPMSGDTEIWVAIPGICTHDVPFWNW